jgi:very-short-patch-repair endonuclease
MARGRGATQRARELRSQSSEAELRLWRFLRRKNVHGHRFRRQYQLGPFYPDFVCLPVKLVVEVDGRQHAEPHQAAHDLRRTAWLERNRFRVLRVWANDVMASIVGVLELIEIAVAEQEALLNIAPLPQAFVAARQMLAPSRKGRGERTSRGLAGVKPK